MNYGSFMENLTRADLQINKIIMVRPRDFAGLVAGNHGCAGSGATNEGRGRQPKRVYNEWARVTAAATANEVTRCRSALETHDNRRRCN